MGLAGLLQLHQFGQYLIPSKGKRRLLSNGHAQLVICEAVAQPTLQSADDLPHSFLLPYFQLQFSSLHPGQLHCYFLLWTSLQRRSLQNSEVQFASIASHPKHSVCTGKQGLGVDAPDCQLRSDSSEGTVEGLLPQMQQLSRIQLLLIVVNGYGGLVCGAVGAETREVAEAGVQPDGLPNSQAVGNQVSSLGYL